MDTIENLIEQPSHSQQLDRSLEQTLRFERSIQISDRVAKENALNELIEQRRRFTASKASFEARRARIARVKPTIGEPVAGTGEAQLDTRKKSVKPLVIAGTLSDSTDSHDDTQRSRSPISPTQEYPSQDTKQRAGAGSTIEKQVGDNAPVKQQFQAVAQKWAACRALLENISIDIDIICRELEQHDHIEQMSSEGLEQEWNESDLASDDDDNDPSLRPVGIEGFTGFGRCLRYKVRWSDGVLTSTKKPEVVERAPTLLKEYLKRRNTEAKRERRKDKAAIRQKTSVIGRPKGSGRKAKDKKDASKNQIHYR